MRKPIHGEELTIVYKGAVVKASCGEVMELPDRGEGVAKFTIVSKTIFQNQTDARLIEGGRELDLRVDRVTTMGHKNLNIVSFLGTFDGTAVREPSGVSAR